MEPWESGAAGRPGVYRLSPEAGGGPTGGGGSTRFWAARMSCPHFGHVVMPGLASAPQTGQGRRFGLVTSQMTSEDAIDPDPRSQSRHDLPFVAIGQKLAGVGSESTTERESNANSVPDLLI